MKYLKLTLIALSIVFANKAYCQIDCTSPSGILGLMGAPVIINPTDVDDFGGSTLIVRGQDKIFLFPPSTFPTNCFNKIKMYVFYSSTSSNLSSLPNLATHDLVATFLKPQMPVTMIATTDPNLYNCSATIPRTSIGQAFGEGQTVFYRWAKLIDDPKDLDPMVWSSILSFKVTRKGQTSSPAPCNSSDLQPAPTNEILIFGGTGGSWNDSAGNVYQKISGEWCRSFFDGSGLLLGNPVDTDRVIGRIFQKTITLPDLTWGVIETSGIGTTTPFINSLSRIGESTPVSTFTATTGIIANGTVSGPIFTGRGTRTVFFFADQNSNSQSINACAVKSFDVVQGNLTPFERGFVISVDNRKVVTECNESNNIRTYNFIGGPGVITNH